MRSTNLYASVGIIESPPCYQKVAVFGILERGDRGYSVAVPG